MIFKVVIINIKKGRKLKIRKIQKIKIQKSVSATGNNSQQNTIVFVLFKKMGVHFKTFLQKKLHRANAIGMYYVF